MRVNYIYCADSKRSVKFDIILNNIIEIIYERKNINARPYNKYGRKPDLATNCHKAWMASKVNLVTILIAPIFFTF